MSLFEQASIFVTPNAFKAGKLYSIKPDSGAGDLDVVRATSRTRVNEQGLVEIPRTNLVLRSEEFNDAYWTKSECTTSANASIAPNGTMTADTITVNTNNAIHRIALSIPISTATTYTLSVYVKKNNFDFIFFRENIDSNFVNTFFNVSNGTLGSVGAARVAKIENVGNGWYRCSVTGTSNLTSYSFGLGVSNTDGVISFLGNGTDYNLIWGAQLEIGNVATEYIPTTSSIRTRFAGITQDGASASNIPALDYTNASCPSILVEPQRTNLALRSEEFDNAAWVKAGVTVDANTAISPDGTANADTINLGLLGFANIRQFIPVANNTSYTVSCYYKNIALTAGQTFEMRYTNELSTPNNFNAIATIDLFNGTVTSQIFGNIGTGYSGSVSSSITNVGNDWYKVTMTFTVGTSGANNGIFRPGVIPISSARTFYIWGAQLEAGSNATSYIPTVASAVTRNADVISKTGISDLIGQTEGTFFAHLNFKNINPAAKYISINNGTNNNRINFVLQGNGSTLILEMSVNGISLANVGLKNLSNLNLFLKIALKYKSGEIKCFVDGQLLFSNTLTYSNAVFDRLLLTNPAGGQPFNGDINSIQLYKTALTDQECINLTTL